MRCQYFTCGRCPNPPVWKRWVIPFYQPPYFGKPPCNGGIPIFASHHDNPVGYYIPCLNRAVPEELQGYFPAVQLKYSIDIFLLGDPPPKGYRYVRKGLTTIEWWDEKYWWIHVDPTSPSRLISGIKRGVKIIGTPLLIKEGDRKAELGFCWSRPGYLSYSYDLLYTSLCEVWGKYDGERIMKEDWYCMPVFLCSMRLTSLYLRKLVSFISSYYNSSGKESSRVIEEVLKVKEMIENVSSQAQDPLYVDPEWYK